MSTQMVAAIGEQMRRRSTEDLLKIWVENDCEMWSDDAFIAVRQILLERGVDLPPQGEPIHRAPVAKPAVDEFWMRWMKAVLVIGIAVGVASGIGGIAQALRTLSAPSSAIAVARAQNAMWLPELIVEHITDLCVPVLLLVAIPLCWQRKPVGRMLMLVWAFAAIGLELFSWGSRMCRLLMYYSESYGWLILSLDRLVRQMAFPAIVALFMTRREIKELFAVGVRGFSPHLPWQAETAAPQSQQQSR